jgi:K+-sensing histidine kinase KdpD
MEGCSHSNWHASERIGCGYARRKATKHRTKVVVVAVVVAEGEGEEEGEEEGRVAQVVVVVQALGARVSVVCQHGAIAAVSHIAG